MERLPLETQTLYAEFLARLHAASAHRSIGQVPGCFVTKVVKGETYYYFQYSHPGGHTGQAYIGKRTPPLEEIVGQFERERVDAEAESASIQRLSAQLRVGGAFHADPASARILQAFADAGVFTLGGVLVGTHAFTVLGNVLGVQWSGPVLRTQDVDIAGEARMHIALPHLEADIPKILESLQLGFLPIPPLNPKNPSTSFKVRGSALRVDFLTPQRRSGKERPVFINRFNVAAHPLPFLDYLLDEYVPAGVVNGGGILVNVPQPGRYALHKLLVSRSRSITDHTKMEKDLQQAVQVMNLLMEERPADMALAWEALAQRKDGSVNKIRSMMTQFKKRFPETYANLITTIPDLV